MNRKIKNDVNEDDFSNLSLNNNNSHNNNNTIEKKIFCRNFNTDEGCRFRGKCKFVHESRNQTSFNKSSRVNHMTKSSLCKNYLSNHSYF